MSAQRWRAAGAFCLAVALATGCAPSAAVTPIGVPEAVASPAPSSAIAAVPDESKRGAFDAPRVTPEQARARIAAEGPAVIVDVRDPESYARSHIEGAINVPVASLADHLDQLPKDKLLLLYCT